MIQRLFRAAPNRGLAIFVELDVNNIWVSADGAVFDIFLAFSSGIVEWHYNVLATRMTYVAGLALQTS